MVSQINLQLTETDATETYYDDSTLLNKLNQYQLKPQTVFTKPNTSKLVATEQIPQLIKLHKALQDWQSSQDIHHFTKNINHLVQLWLYALQQGTDIQNVIRLLTSFELNTFAISQSAKFHAFLLDLLAETSSQQQALNLNYLQNYDAATQLPNANQIAESLEKAISITEETELVAIFSMQFQLSKNNPIFSSVFAASLSKAVAEVLQMNIPAGNFIHYHGNLQFDILLPSLSNNVKLNLLVAKLMRAFEQMLEIENQSVLVTPYIGCAYNLKNDVNAEHILLNARLALENALITQQHFVIFTAELKKQLETQSNIENKVLAAFADDDLTLYFQPVMDIKNDQCVGAELLLRIQEKSKLSAHPGLVVEILNKVGRGKAFTRWLINSACRYAAELKYEHNLSIYLTINLRAEDLYDIELPHLLLQATSLWKIDPKNLVLEVTENGVLELNETSNGVINDLAKSGFKFALDDFGTGFSSLSRLRNMPIDIIKIDQTFVRDITHSKNDYAIVKSIAELANSLGKEVIAEGVEDEKSLVLIKKIKIGKCQGYFYAKPMPFEKFIIWAKQHP